MLGPQRHLPDRILPRFKLVRLQYVSRPGFGAYKSNTVAYNNTRVTGNPSLRYSTSNDRLLYLYERTGVRQRSNHVREISGYVLTARSPSTGRDAMWAFNQGCFLRRVVNQSRPPILINLWAAASFRSC